MSERISKASEPIIESEFLSSRAGAAVLAGIILVATGDLYFFYWRGLSNVYGDGIAHVEGARRLFDSLTPGYWEIGSAWLPLFHILAAPLALNQFLWKTGLAGSLVSAAAYIVAAWFLFRLSLAMNRNLSAAVVSLTAFLFCPSMAYLASVPLTEALNLMWAVLTVYGLFRFREFGRTAALLGAGAAAFLGALTRYDGWYLLPFAALFVLTARSEPVRDRLRHAAVFSMVAGAGPVLWFVHNAVRFGNVLEFYNGPYSAMAIYAHQLATTSFRYPTDGSVLIAARYYLADLMLVIGVWPLALAALGWVVWAADGRERARQSAALLFLVPFIFYIHSMAHAAVPLYVPTLFPFTFYNLRYGIEVLPAVSIFPSFVLSSRLPSGARAVLLTVMLGTLAFQEFSLLSRGARELAVVQEGLRNNPCHTRSQQALIDFFRDRYDGRMIVVAAGKWPCLMPAVGIPFRQTISETNRRYWKKLRFGPGKEVEWIIRGDGDVVDGLMRAYPEGFRDFDSVERNQFPGEGSVEIYRRRAV
jgi:hypothetical protein